MAKPDKTKGRACPGCGAMVEERDLTVDANGNQVHLNHFFLTGNVARISNPDHAAADEVLPDNYLRKDDETP
ncbi:MAG: hypothetical protein KF883_04750 [Thermomicrobiales bacterium]|nr:hypothetical protein [Thermomicrobiales bacterium]